MEPHTVSAPDVSIPDALARRLDHGRIGTDAQEFAADRRCRAEDLRGQPLE